MKRVMRCKQTAVTGCTANVKELSTYLLQRALQSARILHLANDWSTSRCRPASLSNPGDRGMGGEFHVEEMTVSKIQHVLPPLTETCELNECGVEYC